MRKSTFLAGEKRVIRTMCRGRFGFSRFLSKRKYSMQEIQTQQSHVGILQMQLLFVHQLIRFIARVDAAQQPTETLITITSRLSPQGSELQQVVIILLAVARILITQHHQQVGPTQNVLV
jgi:hypothetical protein